MNANEIIEGLVKAITGIECWNENEELIAPIAAASAFLKTGGWHKWPEEKPRDKKETYLVGIRFANGPFRDTDLYVHGGWARYGNAVFLWQPLPALPEDQPKGDKR